MFVFSYSFPHRRGSFFGQRYMSYCSCAPLIEPPVTLACLTLMCHGAPQVRYLRASCCSWHQVLAIACQAHSMAPAALCLTFYTWSDIFAKTGFSSFKTLLIQASLWNFARIFSCGFSSKFGYEILKECVALSPETFLCVLSSRLEAAPTAHTTVLRIIAQYTGFPAILSGFYLILG